MGGKHVNRTVLAATTLAAGIGLLAAGCGGSASGAAAQKSGTETIAGKLTGQAALASNPVFHLTFHGPVNTTATHPLGTAPKKGETTTINTAAGVFAIVAGTSSTTEKLLSTSTCRVEFATTVPYVISGSKSTGQFAGGTGNGHVVVLFVGDLPKKNGKCDTSATAQPKTSTVVATFTAVGPLTLK
jgi:hypothetical protein